MMDGLEGLAMALMPCEFDAHRFQRRVQLDALHEERNEHGEACTTPSRHALATRTPELPTVASKIKVDSAISMPIPCF